MFKIKNAVKTKPEIKENIIFTDEDIVNIFSNLNLVKSNLLTTIYLLFYTGLRSTDMMTLQVGKIDIVFCSPNDIVKKLDFVLLFVFCKK